MQEEECNSLYLKTSLEQDLGKKSTWDFPMLLAMSSKGEIWCITGNHN